MSFAHLRHIYLGLLPNRYVASVVGRKTPLRVSSLVVAFSSNPLRPGTDRLSKTKRRVRARWQPLISLDTRLGLFPRVWGSSFDQLGADLRSLAQPSPTNARAVANRLRWYRPAEAVCGTPDSGVGGEQVAKVTFGRENSVRTGVWACVDARQMLSGSVWASRRETASFGVI